MTSCRRPTTLLASGAGPPRHRRALEFSWQRPGNATSASTLEMMKCKKDKKWEDAKMNQNDITWYINIVFEIYRHTRIPNEWSKSSRWYSLSISFHFSMILQLFVVFVAVVWCCLGYHVFGPNLWFFLWMSRPCSTKVVNGARWDWLCTCWCARCWQSSQAKGAKGSRGPFGEALLFIDCYMIGMI